MATTRLDKKNQTYDESEYLNLQYKDLIWKFGKKKKISDSSLYSDLPVRLEMEQSMPSVVWLPTSKSTNKVNSGFNDG